MKTNNKIDAITIIVLLVLGTLGFFFIRAIAASTRKARAISAVSRLLGEHRDFNGVGAITNRPGWERVFIYTNLYTISGSNYQCTLAVDSWSDRENGDLLAITTNGALLFIGEHGAVPMNRSWVPPGY